MSQRFPTVITMTIAFYDKLHLLGRTVGRGPIHRKETTVLELINGNRAVLGQFRSKPGRWTVVVETALGSCPTCDSNVTARFLQFLALEDGESLLGECGSNFFLDEDQQFTPAQEGQLRALGWSDPSPPQLRNWFFEVRSSEDLDYLDELTTRTIREVFGLCDSETVYVSFHDVKVGAPYFRCPRSPGAECVCDRRGAP
jgi:hypothetical protein